jgi:hypothetical protein
MSKGRAMGKGMKPKFLKGKAKGPPESPSKKPMSAFKGMKSREKRLEKEPM